MENTILYSTGCPKCEALKNKLKRKGVQYIENNSVEEMLSIGISEVPVLMCDGKMLSFADAVKWIDNQ